MLVSGNLETSRQMLLKDTIGKTITNIFCLVDLEVGGLDNGECFIELDNKTIIGIPFDPTDDDLTKSLDKKANSIFADLSDIPVHHINKERKTVGEVVASHKKRQASIFYKIQSALFGESDIPKEYKPYKVEYRENKLKYLKDRKIIDFIWYPDDTDKGFFLLDNNYLISETSTAPHGTGLAGLNYFESLSSLIDKRGVDYLKLTDKGSR